MTPGGTISTSPTFNSTLREPTATPPPQPGPFGPPSGLFVLRRPLPFFLYVFFFFFSPPWVRLPAFGRGPQRGQAAAINLK